MEVAGPFGEWADLAIGVEPDLRSPCREQAQRRLQFVFGDAQAPLARGWAELKSDDEFIATEFFQLLLGDLKPRVGVLPSPPSEEIRFFGFVNNRFKSGMAVHRSRCAAVEYNGSVQFRHWRLGSSSEH